MINIIKLIEPIDPGYKNIILELQREHQEEVKGISELYDELYSLGKCESYNLDRINFIANTLNINNIKFTLRT